MDLEKLHKELVILEDLLFSINNDFSKKEFNVTKVTVLHNLIDSIQDFRSCLYEASQMNLFADYDFVKPIETL